MPGEHGRTTDATRAVEHAFYRAIYASKLLFNKGVYDKLEVLRKRAIEWTHHKQNDEHAKAGAIYEELLHLTESLDDFFGDELKLGRAA